MNESTRHSDNQPGTLALVGTPIGNLEDISLRALRFLKEADLIAAEDTRRTRKLLTHFNISQRVVSYYEHNEEKRIPTLLKALHSGKNVALVSDAGTPGISDPGYRLVRQAAEAGILVTAVPGPSAITLALSLSGLPTDRFSFFGFLSRGKNDRKKQLQDAAGIPHTLLFFESPHRVVKSLEQMLEIFGDREAAICRELTKRFEEIQRGVLSELIRKIKEKPPKGEFCIVIAGLTKKASREAEKQEKIAKAIEELKNYSDEPLKEVARRIAKKYGLSTREVYQLAIHHVREEDKA